MDNYADDNWTYAVERHCSGALTGWMVDNPEDCKLLKQILQRHNAERTTVFTRRLNRPRFNCGFTTAESHRCMASMVEVEDNDVFNLLIDIHHLHKVFLYDDTDKALTDMKKAPRNCTLALDIEYLSLIHI